MGDYKELFSIEETISKPLSFSFALYFGQQIKETQLNIVEGENLVYHYTDLSGFIVGPSEKQQDELQSIEYFLRETGNKELINCLKPSNVPYRG